ncbi:MAG: dihydroneopterin aldolase [Prevotella sp.]|nr:dihydroneopterin aldolase [Prevotella sp.]
MNSRIFIAGLRMRACHGVLPQERVVGGDFEVSLSVEYDISRAMATDDVADTLSYADLSDLVRREMAVPSNLLEHVAGRIARAIVQRWPEVQSVNLSITKLNPPMGADCDGAGVELYLINDKTQ